MTYQEALQYLDRFINYEKKNNYDYELSFKLDRMKRLCSLLGDPQKETRSIHVAGTKGKGSTSAIIQSILKSSGFKTGLYTSPHLLSFCERIRINDTLMAEEDVGAILDTVKIAVDEMGEEIVGRELRPEFVKRIQRIEKGGKYKEFHAMKELRDTLGRS